MGVPENKSIIITRLTALWALSECALGGVMHASKIPFTGIFVGGMSVICISLISLYATSVFRDVMKATLLVLMVKAGVSPHTPVPAYIAVSFQGLLGAIMFSLIKKFRIAALLFTTVAITESAIQKFLFTTLLFGKSIWVALDVFMNSVLRDLNIPSGFSFSFWIITSYVLLYTIWGMVLGLFIGRMPAALNEIKQQKINIQKNAIVGANKKRRFTWLVYMLMMMFVAIVFFFEDRMNLILYILLRSLAVTMVLFLAVRPLIVFLISHFGKNKKRDLYEIMNLLPEISAFIKPAYELSVKNKKGINKYSYFVLYLIHFTISDHADE